MKRLFGAGLTLAFALCTPYGADAQSVFVAAGATIPTGDYGDYAKTGWGASVGALLPVGTAGVALGARGFYGSNNHDVDGEKTNLFGGMAMVNYSFQTGTQLTPFVSGQFGFMSHQFKTDDPNLEEGTESGAAFALGGGLGFPLGGVQGFVAAAYQQGLGDIDTTKFIGVVAGVSIPLGG